MPLLRPVIVAPTLFALAALSGPHRAAAQASSSFIIAMSEGYGVGDCLADGGACGQVIADAWCVAHGAKHAISFGPAGAMEAATEGAAPDAPPGSLVISCGQ